jgi:iron complex outermembrane recepter protein
MTRLSTDRLLLSGIFVACISTHTLAQTQTTSSASSAQNSASPRPHDDVGTATGTSDETSSLEEVIVTARRVKENLQSVPIAVTVFSGAALQEQNVVSIQDLNAKVPSLQTSNGNARDQVYFSLRGQTQTYGGSEPAVVAYFAEVPTNAGGATLLYDIDNLEVLKGPQGTLFGRNTTGGAILINPQRPTDQFGGYVDLSTGDYGLARTQAAINVPIIDDKLLVRLAVDSNQRRGFTEDLQNGEYLDGIHYTSFRASVIARPVQGVENYIVYDQSNSNTHGGGYVLSALVPGSLVAQIDPAIVPYYATQQARGVRTVQYDTGADYDRVYTQSLTDILSYTVSDSLLVKAIFGYREFAQWYTSDADGSPFPLLQLEPSPNGNPFTGDFGGPSSSKLWTGEVQLQGKSFANNLNWTAGVYYEHGAPYSSLQEDNIVQIFSHLLVQALRYDSSKAIYGQGSYNLDALLPGLSVTGGLRYTEDNRTLVSNTTTNGICTQEDANAECFRRQDATFSSPTYTASVEYKINPDTLIYIASRKGYKSGGFNASVPIDVPATSFKPETVQDGEFGIKSDFKLGSVPARVNADYYHSKYYSIQQSGNFLAPDGTIISATTNLGSATIQGLELEGTIIPVTGLDISGFFAYINAQYDTVGLLDAPFYNIPKSKVGITPEYKFPIGDVGTLVPGASFTYQSYTHISNTPDAHDVQGGYGLLDAHLDWRGVFGSKLDLSAFGTNLTNKTYGEYAVNLYSALGFNVTFYGPPRMYGVRARYSF